MRDALLRNQDDRNSEDMKETIHQDTTPIKDHHKDKDSINLQQNS